MCSIGAFLVERPQVEVLNHLHLELPQRPPLLQLVLRRQIVCVLLLALEVLMLRVILLGLLQLPLVEPQALPQKLSQVQPPTLSVELPQWLSRARPQLLLEEVQRLQHPVLDSFLISLLLILRGPVCLLEERSSSPPRHGLLAEEEPFRHLNLRSGQAGALLHFARLAGC